MFFGGVFFQLPEDLPYAKGQQKNENFGETFPFSGVFTTCKKKKFFRRIFRLPGIYPMEGEKMKKIIFFETVFRFSGINPVKGNKMKKFNFFETVFQLPGFLPYERRTE